MKVAIYLGHPAHFYLFKNTIYNLRGNGVQVEILIKKKDILEQLLQNANLEYHNILEEGRTDSRWGIMWGTIKRTLRFIQFCREHKPDVLAGTCVEAAWISKLLSIPFINTEEDDADVIPLYAKLSYPISSTILTPEVCDNGKWNEVSTKYNSYHELSYLHPNHFIPNKEVVEKYFSTDTPYYIIRFVKFNAHHDNGIKGINAVIAQKLIDILKLSGNIYITSERELEPQFEQYRIKINPLDMHHVMAFADLYVGDSQTMAAEAGVLGVPFVRFNDFVGCIGYLRELEDVYQLGYGIRTKDVDRMYEVVEELMNMVNRKEVFKTKQKKMLADKIDFAKYLTWFIEGYPKSKAVLKENPDYQYRFK